MRKMLIQSDWPVAILLVASTVLWVLGDYQQAGPDPQLILFGVSSLAWYVLGLMIIAWVASRTSLPRVAYRQCLFLLALCAVPAVVLLWLASVVDSENAGNIAFAVLMLVVVGVLAWGLRRVSGQRQGLAVWLSLMTAIGFGWASDALYMRPTVWYAMDAEGEAQDRSAWRNAERLFFEQPERIDSAVGQIAAREPGRPNAYFVGFAGFGDQKVFAEEIDLASRVIGTKFSSTARSVSLVNDRRDLGGRPLATASGLRRTLLAVGKRMDPDSDVLFLVLSSHGAEGAELVVQNGGLPLRQLGAAELADAIRDAGIRWKVVIISACYSGAFIDALKDDYSIILTASAPDRTSFGCADDRDLTYFGEAFFRDALPGAPSLREAFARASADILRRELQEGIEPSSPQSFFGAEGEKHVASLRIAQGALH